METCNGFELSDCCGDEIVMGDICLDCGEHCSTQCTDCEVEECDDRMIFD